MFLGVPSFLSFLRAFNEQLQRAPASYWFSQARKRGKSELGACEAYCFLARPDIKFGFGRLRLLE